MKTIIRIVCIISICCMITYRLQACPPESCAANLKDAYSFQMHLLQTANTQNKAWYLKYTMSSKVYDRTTGKERINVSGGEVFATKYVRHMKSDDVEIYMDATDVFTIDYSAKKITRAASTPAVLKMDLTPMMSYINDSLLSNANLVHCSSAKEANGVATTRYDIVPADKTKSPVLQTAIYFDNNTHINRKIYVEMNPAYSPVRWYLVEVHELGQKPMDPGLLPVKNKVLNASGQLLPAFSKFKYQDLKNMKK